LSSTKPAPWRPEAIREPRKTMPYIPKKDRPAFEEGIDSLRLEINQTSSGGREPLLGRLGYVYLEVNKRAMPALRYWTLAEGSGIMENVPAEMERRLKIRPLPYEGDPVIPEATLDPLIDALVAVVKKISQKYDQAAQPPGSYPAAYAGLINFSLTTLALRIVLDKSQKGGLDLELLRQIPALFHRVANEFYLRLAGPYEDLQIAKSENGDLPEYEEVQRRAQKDAREAKR